MPSCLRASPRHAAFTLLELLVVVGILAILISIIVPTLGIAREQARRAVCASNLHHWGAALADYMGDNRGYLPSTVTLFGAYYPSFVQTKEYPPGQPPTWGPLTTTGGMYSLTLLQPYVGKESMDTTLPLIRGIWKCPDSDSTIIDPDSINSGAPPSPPFGNGTGFGCLYSDYSYFARVDLWQKLATGGSYASNPTELVGRIPRATQILMADDIYRWSNNGNPVGEWTFNHGVRGRIASFYGDTLPTRLGGANELYGDMHVEWKDGTMFDKVAMEKLETTAVGVVPASRFVIGNSPSNSYSMVLGVSPTPTTGYFDATFYVP